MKYVVDTHALIWFLEGNPRLGANAKTILSDPTSKLIIPTIVLAEAAWIVERGKTSIPSVAHLFGAIDADPRIYIYPVDEIVVKQSVSLSAINEMHDRQIVATTIVIANQGETVALLTCDRNITASGLVQHGGNNYAVKKLLKAFAISIFPSALCPLPSAFLH